MKLQVGRQLRAGSLQLRLNLSAELHDVIARRHLHADNQAVGIFLRATFVEIDILGGCGIAALDGRYVFEAQGGTRGGV